MSNKVKKTFRMSEELADELTRKSEDAGMKESEYIRYLISQRPADHREVREGIQSLMLEVNRIGVNINQVVHNNNSHLYSDSDKARLFAYMRKINEAVVKVVESVGDK